MKKKLRKAIERKARQAIKRERLAAMPPRVNMPTATVTINTLDQLRGLPLWKRINVALSIIFKLK